MLFTFYTMRVKTLFETIFRHGEIFEINSKQQMRFSFVLQQVRKLIKYK